MRTETLQQHISPFLSKRLNSRATRAFLFGSSIKKDHFYDVDIGLMGDVDAGKTAQLKFDFEESNFPYKVDIVDFNTVNPGFREHVLDSRIVWLDF